MVVPGGFHHVCVVVGRSVLISSSDVNEAVVVRFVVDVHHVDGFVIMSVEYVGLGLVTTVLLATVLKLNGGSIVVISLISYVNISVK